MRGSLTINDIKDVTNLREQGQISFVMSPLKVILLQALEQLFPRDTKNTNRRY